MVWFMSRLPVADDERAWIEESLTWLVSEFGAQVLHRPVVEPTRRFFPVAGFRGRDNVAAVLEIVAGAMDVPHDRVELDYVAATDVDGRRLYEHAYSGPAGHYHQHDGKDVVTVYGAETSTPMTLIATIAHELGHARLLGEGRIPWDRRDCEPLTDLLTVVFGLGVFTANASFEFAQDHRGWQSRRLGYLTEQMFGYALARYSLLRDEPDPGWAAFLDTNPRAYMKQALRHLIRAGS